MSAPQRPRSVLWIDDEPDSVEGTRASLEFDGHEVLAVESVAEATEHLRNRPIDIFLVDERLAKEQGAPQSGSEMVRQLRMGELGHANAGIPFAFVTANPGLVDADSVADMSGFQGLFSKAGSLTRDLSQALTTLFTIPGLVDSTGNALSNDSPASQAVIRGFRTAQAEVVDILAEEPQLLHALHHREFEELIAELFARNGFDVDLTSRTGDGGADLYAVRQTGMGEHRYVIECKQNAPHNRVGPALVRQLRGVVDREVATCGVLITTSTFTAGAHEEQQTTPHRLSLRDFEHVAGWLQGSPIFD